MSFTGLVPGENSTGLTQRRGSITRAGNAHLSSSPFGLRALRVDTGAPPTAQKRSGGAPLVRRIQKAVIRTFAWEVDRPFHINAGIVAAKKPTPRPASAGSFPVPGPVDWASLPAREGADHG